MAQYDDNPERVAEERVDEPSTAHAHQPGESSDPSSDGLVATVRGLAVRSIAHRMRTPLSVVLGPIHAAARHPGLDGQLRRQLEVALEQAEIVNADLDELAEVGAWPDRPQLVPSRLGDLLADVGLARLSARSWQGLDYSIDTHDTADVLIDPAMTRWAIDALLHDLIAGGRQDDSVSLRCRDDGGDVVATIEVRGRTGRPPVPEHELVSVAAMIVGLLGGTIDRPRGAASFELRIPASATPGGSEGSETASTRVSVSSAPAVASRAAADAPADAPVSGPQEAPVVLVVEDDTVLRRYLAEHLSVEHRVVTSTSAEGAVTALARLRPDLVVCDLQLPGAGGEHLVHHLQGDPELAGIPIVVVSGRNDDEQRIRLLRAGIDDYVTKPFSPDELVARIANLLARTVDLDALRARASRAQEVADQLQRALETRVVIEQAKAFVAADRGIDVGEAFEVLRRHARSNNVKLREVATAVVDEGFRP